MKWKKKNASRKNQVLILTNKDPWTNHNKVSLIWVFSQMKYQGHFPPVRCPMRTENFSGDRPKMIIMHQSELIFILFSNERWFLFILQTMHELHDDIAFTLVEGLPWLFLPHDKWECNYREEPKPLWHRTFNILSQIYCMVKFPTVFIENRKICKLSSTGKNAFDIFSCNFQKAKDKLCWIVLIVCKT